MDAGHFSGAEAASLSLDAGQPKGLALPPIVTDQVANVVAGVGVLAAAH
jgi:hypothetical protein